MKISVLLLLLFYNLSLLFSQIKHLNPKDFVIIYNVPKKILKLSDDHYFIDFGKAYFGTVALKFTTDYKDSIIIHLGEKAINNLVDRSPGGTIRYQKIVQYDFKEKLLTDIRLKPDKRNTTPPAILLPDEFGVVMPFRYCEIKNLKIPIEKVEIYQKALIYRFDDNAGYFNTSNEIFNKILDLCKHTIKATTFTGYYIDGDRERIPYEADAYINQLSHFCVDTVYSIAKRTIKHFFEYPTWPTEWILHTSMLLYHYFLYTGDTNFLVEYYEPLKAKSLIELEREDGLISTKSPALNDELIKKLGFKNTKTRISDIVDWPTGERDNYEMLPINTVVNTFYYNNLVLLSKIAGILKKKDDSIYFYKKSEKVKNSINNKLINKEKGLYVDGEGSLHSSLHANMFPIVFNLVPEEYENNVISFIKSRGMACSVYGAQYLLESLYKCGESEYAFRLMTDTSTDRSWWNMIKVGSTMTMEAWDMKYKPNLDWNHAWATAPLNIYVRYMWGIIPEKAAFEKVSITPKLDGLNSATVKLPTIRGTIFAKFVRIKNKEVYEIELPSNVYGNFYFDLKKTSKVLCNNKKIKKANFAKLKPGKNKIIITIKK